MNKRELQMRFLIVYALLGYIIYCLKSESNQNGN